ncbi:MAG: gamma carbonic anhydrase family protein [Verrucomicrobiota bacterium]|nr:gamma carbonic anhydrase family protein [Verrucomicrobiota bacterium]
MNINQRLANHLSKQPDLHPTVFVAPTATVIGDVVIGIHSSVWYSAVVRGDINFIKIGEGTNIQDAAVVHLADDYPALIGNYTTVGHSAVIHACTIGDEVLIGMGAIVLDGATVGNQCIIGANALVKKDMIIPDGSLVLGSPGKIIRALSPEERADLRSWAEKYVHVAQAHKMLPRG